MEKLMNLQEQTLQKIADQTNSLYVTVFKQESIDISTMIKKMQIEKKKINTAIQNGTQIEPLSSLHKPIQVLLKNKVDNSFKVPDNYKHSTKNLFELINIDIEKNKKMSDKIILRQDKEMQEQTYKFENFRQEIKLLEEQIDKQHAILKIFKEDLLTKDATISRFRESINDTFRTSQDQINKEQLKIMSDITGIFSEIKNHKQ